MRTRLRQGSTARALVAGSALLLGLGCSIDITPRLHPGGQLVEVVANLETVRNCRRMGTMRNVTGLPGAGVRARNLAWEAGGDTILDQETRNDLYDCARFGIPVLKLEPRTDLPTLDLAHPPASANAATP